MSIGIVVLIVLNKKQYRNYIVKWGYMDFIFYDYYMKRKELKKKKKKDGRIIPCGFAAARHI